MLPRPSIIVVVGELFELLLCVSEMRNLGIGCVGLVLIAVSGCKSLPTGVYREGLTADNGEPGYITVQHCLIAFSGSGTSATRSKEEAETLAMELFEKAKQGEDFERMVVQYTDDSPPGIYRMANHGFEGDMSNRIPSRNVFRRDGMVPAFGDTGFPLKVGEYGLAPFDTQKSPYGWHIVKRIK